jgi:hypothetical protein
MVCFRVLQDKLPILKEVPRVREEADFGLRSNV